MTQETGQGQPEPATAQPAHPATAAEPRRRFIDRRPSREPVVAGLLLAGAVAGGIIFHDQLGQTRDNFVAATGIGRDGSNQGTPTASSAAAGDGEKAKALREKEIADAVAKAFKEQADAKAKADADKGKADADKAKATAPATAASTGPDLCDVMAITNLPARPDANINGIAVRLQVRDNDQCSRPLFYNETGIAAGQNYKVNLPKGWSVVTASVSVEVHKKGGKAKQYTNGPVVRVDGPFQGGIGEYEGSFGVVPTEWADAYVNNRLPIQRQQTKNPNLQVTVHAE